MCLTVVLLGVLSRQNTARALDLYSDNLGITAGTADTNTTAAQANSDKIADAMVTIANAGSGTLYFRGNSGAYRILAPIYPLPNVNMAVYQAVGTDPTTATIKNVYHDTANPGPDGSEYWMAPVLFGGYDNPAVNYQSPSPGETSPTFYGFNGRWPVAGDTYMLVGSAGYNAVSINDEVRLLSASNAVDTGRGVARPNYAFKAVINSKTSGGSPMRYYLYLTCDSPSGAIPFSLPQESTANCAQQYGTVTLGNPAWYRAKDFYSTSNPKYWATSGQYGHDAYAALSGWTPGITSRGYSPTTPMTFSNITFWSKYGRAMFRAMPCNASFTNCAFKGQSCVYGNSCQNTTFTGCTGLFWDTAVEFAYNAQFVTMTNCTFSYDSSINYGGYSVSTTRGIFIVHERSNTMTFTGAGSGLTLNLTNASSGDRTITSNSLFVMSGENMNFTKITASLPQYDSALFYLCKDLDGNYPTTGITFGSTAANTVTFNMNNHSFTTLAALKQSSNNITFQNIAFTNADTSTAGKNQISIGSGGDNTANHCYFYNVDMPSPGATNVGAMNLQADFTGQEIHVNTACTLKGITGANVANGIIGTVTGAITIDP